MTPTRTRVGVIVVFETDNRKKTMVIVTADISTDYASQIDVGTTIHSKSGFIIGTIVDVVEQ